MLIWLVLLTRLLNDWFAAPVDALLRAVHVTPLHPYAPIPYRLTLELVVFFVLIVFFVLARLSLSVEKPGAAQHVAEYVHEFVEGQAQQMMGHGYEPHLPVLTCLLLFILLCNCMGLLPGIETPTASPVVPLGLALFTFVYYNWFGVKAQGPVGYIKHFMGPLWWLSPLLFPIEIISHLARILSLTVRLFANMFASDLLTLVIFSFIPFLAPIFGLGLHFGVALIQSYVFMALAAIYLTEATAHHDHGEATADL